MRILTGGLWVAAAALCVGGGVAIGADKGLTDESFVKQAAQDGMTEVEMGNVAAEKASADDVKTFARAHGERSQQGERGARFAGRE